MSILCSNLVWIAAIFRWSDEEEEEEEEEEEQEVVEGHVADDEEL